MATRGRLLAAASQDGDVAGCVAGDLGGRLDLKLSALARR